MEKGDGSCVKEFGIGVVIGKFLPPHKGHRFLIESALKRCDRVVVIGFGKPTDPIPGELRAGWLGELAPSAEVMLIDDRYDENDSRVWAENTVRWLGRAPDVVFTSENYGDRYAGFLGCQHVMVDRALLLAALSEGETELINLLVSDDVRHMLEAMSRLGLPLPCLVRVRRTMLQSSDRLRLRP